MLKVLRDPSDRDHEGLREWLGSEFDAEAFDSERTNENLQNPDYLEDDDDEDDEDYEDDDGGDLLLSPDELAALDERQLVEHLIDLEDRAPRYVIDACAARGGAMVAILEEPCRDEEFWGPEAAEDECSWWLRFHGACILGLIPNEAAGNLLVEWMRRLDAASDDNMQEWLTGNWPALFANKPEPIAEPLLALMRDRERSWYTRSDAADAYLRCRSLAGTQALEEALDQVAQIIEDETEEFDTRDILATYLLSFPRERHRAALEHIAEHAKPWTIARQDIDESFAKGEDDPQWARFENPWRFYEPERIAERQQRWAEESRTAAAEDFDDTPARAPAPEIEDPYLRKQPKIGRNDPCPCGSGKKFKKCCMNGAGGTVH
jgi:hypothetical protein